MSDTSESYRRHMLARLQNKFSHGDPPDIRAHREALEKYETEKSESRAQIERLLHPMATSEFCPECWYIRGVEARLRAIPHPDPANYDRFTCEICNYVDDRPSRGV